MIVSRRLVVFVALASFAGRAEALPGFTDVTRPLIRSGKFFGKIRIPREAAPEERAAAESLALWIRRVTGATAEIVAEGPDELGPGIYVGATAAAKREGVVAPYSVSHDAFARAVRPGGRLFLVGESPRATRFATGRFIRRELGVVFVMPGDYGADWKPLRIVRMPDSDTDEAPRFAWRAMTGFSRPAEREWYADMGLGGIPMMSHNLWRVFDAKAFAENPAMFPMRGGVRVAPSGRGGYEPQPDLANPDSAKYAAKRAYEFFKDNPDAPAFSLSINDNMTWDDSPESKAALGYGKYFRNRPDYSDYVFRFMNRAAVALRAAEIEDQRVKIEGTETGGRPFALPSSVFNLSSSSENVPRRFLTGYAYYHCEDTPSFPVEPEVFPVLTADRSEWRDPAFAAEDAALMDRWAKSGAARFGIYDYYYGVPMTAPRLFLKAEADSIRYAAEAGASLFYGELNPDWGFDGPKAWLAAELLWNPDAGPERLLNKYFDSGYGPAADAMRAFFAEAEDRWTHRNVPPLWIRFYMNESVCELFPADVRRRMRASLDEADRAFDRDTPFVAGNAARRARMRMRVRTTSLSFAKFEALADRYDAVKALSLAPPAADAAGVERIRKLETVCETADRRYREAVATWNTCPLNPGGPVTPDAVAGTDAPSLAAEKAGTAARGVSGDFADKAAVLEEMPRERVVSSFVESFEAPAFRPAAPGTWAAAKGLSIPRAPWLANIFEGEKTRFGFAPGRGIADTGALAVGGGDLAKLTRSFVVAAGDMAGARVRYRGKIIPGVHVALTLAFYDAQGAQFPGMAATQAFPGDDRGWRTLALAGRAPAGATSAAVMLSVAGQVADDEVVFDDFSARRLPANR